MAADITGNSPAFPGAEPRYFEAGVESRFSGVSWGAIVAGGVAAAAMAMILMTLGAGLGLIAISPWRGEGVSAGTIGIGVIIWSIIVEIAAFGIGGYLAGRLRTKWANLHGDEVFFRDTAHGLVTWALGTLVFVGLSAAVAGYVARGTAEAGLAATGAAAAGGAAMVNATPDANSGMMAGGPAGGPMAGGPAAMRPRGNPMDYYIDMLFRPTAGGTAGAATGGATGTNGTATPPAATPPAMGQAMGGSAMGGQADLGPERAEIARIVAADFKDGQITLSAPDRTYIAQLVAQRTGLSQQDAEKRVDDTVAQAKAAIDDLTNKAKQAADDARKAGAGLALWSFVAMLIGAFTASYAATLGGRHRDL